MKILVTGASGFIGSCVVRELLRQGIQVRAVYVDTADTQRIADVINQIEVCPINLNFATNEELQALCAGIDCCIHCAWYTIPGKYVTAPENVDCIRSSLRLFEALGKSQCRHVVGVGTCFEYDLSYGFLAEDTPIKPSCLYAAAKASTWLMGQEICALHNIRFSWARLFYLYGPWEDPRRLVASIIRSLSRGESVGTTQGKQVRDFLHVEDAGAALAAIALSDLSGAINVASGVPVTVRSIVNMLGSELNRPDLICFGARPENLVDPPFVCANIGRLRSCTAWQPRYDLDTGFKQVIRWWQAHL